MAEQHSSLADVPISALHEGRRRGYGDATMGGKSVVFALAALGLGLTAGPALAECHLSRFAELPVSMSGAQPVVSAKINGQDVRLLADSGAFFSMLTASSAQRLGLKPGPAPSWLRVRGVNGEAEVKLAKVQQFTALGRDIKNVDFLVGGTDNSAHSGIDGMLGRNIIGLEDVEFDLANGVIRLFLAKGCEKSALAYWSKGDFEIANLLPDNRKAPPIVATATVNGVKLKAILDTGAGRSILTRAAARRVGIRLDGPDVVAGGAGGGIGSKSVETWIAPVESFGLGDEQVQKTRLRVGTIELGDDADMLLGADFFLSHRLFVSRTQNRIYFTYNGGQVFNLDRAPERGPPRLPPQPPVTAQQSAEAAGPAPAAGAEEPKDAAGFARRGQALMARRDFARAIDDFSRAIELEPNSAEHFYERATAKLANRQPILAMSDLEQALRIDPRHAPALMGRARLRLGSRDEAGAQADFEAAAKVNPNLRLAIAETYSVADRLETAVAWFTLWIDGHPRDDALAVALNDRCWARALMGRDLDKALADCDAALKLRPKTSSFLDSRGLARLRLGQLDEAIADYDEAVKLQPKGAWSLYGRGLARIRKGLQAEGEADLRAAAALDANLAQYARRHGLGAEAGAQPSR
jgi:tetratricopeptide (TPR) repeat protein/predicted aspartyl protease